MISENTIIGGRYRVTRPLGGGGMKLVYLAEDLRLAARPCALAEMVDSFTDPNMQQQAVAAFQREADMLAQISNEHIPRVFDRFSDQNRHYLVMEFVDGITLEQALGQEGGKLGEARVIDIALQVLDTLIYLHNLEPPVIYRDLKPSNVMLTRNGQVKLIDFGIARFFHPQINATMIGTQGYAPPEQYRGRAESRSDLYALGATMHHALSGRDPANEAPFSFPPLNTLAPEVSPALAELVDQALQYDLLHRMADAADFKQRLLAIKSGQGAAAVTNGQRSPSARAPVVLPPHAVTAQALTRIGGSGDVACEQCRRSIPADSRFCSFCGNDLTRARAANGTPAASHEASTVVLTDPAPPLGAARPSTASFPNYRPRRDPRPLRFIAVLLIVIFISAFAAARVITYMQQSFGSPPAAENPPVPIPPASSYENPGPTTPEPEHRSPLAATLRQWLNIQGYASVHFRLEGNEVVLWGTVPDEFERQWVRAQAAGLTGATTVIDHMVVSNNSAPDEPDGP